MMNRFLIIFSSINIPIKVIFTESDRNEFVCLILGYIGLYKMIDYLGKEMELDKKDDENE